MCECLGEFGGTGEGSEEEGAGAEEEGGGA